MRNVRCGVVFVLGGCLSVPGLAWGQGVMPGHAVGKSSIVRVGEAPPGVGQPAGKPISYTGPGGMPVQTARPQGKIIDLTNLSAPLSAPLSPDLVEPEPRSVFTQAYERWLKFIGLDNPPPPTTPNVTPGIFRRNRERNKFTWWRD
jgi:hypothetical protein